MRLSLTKYGRNKLLQAFGLNTLSDVYPYTFYRVVVSNSFTGDFDSIINSSVPVPYTSIDSVLSDPKESSLLNTVMLPEYRFRTYSTSVLSRLYSLGVVLDSEDNVTAVFVSFIRFKSVFFEIFLKEIFSEELIRNPVLVDPDAVSQLEPSTDFAEVSIPYSVPDITGRCISLETHFKELLNNTLATFKLV